VDSGVIEIRRLETLPDAALGPLLAQSQADGHGMVAKLRKHWISGAQRFDADGEALYGAYGDGLLVGVCGRAIDPYRNDVRVARVQRLYVLPRWRGKGVGRALVGRVLQDGAGRFTTVTVRAPTADASRFYEALGFAPVAGETETHVLTL
jgi:GNAT superfamily N-acetyltransferase